MEETRSYFGCRIIQRKNHDTTPLFVFYANAHDIIKWAGIRRASESPEGTQRLLRETRRKSITRFLKVDDKNTIPNNILLAFEPGKAKFTSLDTQITNINNVIDVHNSCNEQVEWGYIAFSFEENLDESSKPALIVDGQHRLYGISDYKDENIPILVVSLIDASLVEQAFQFIVINSKAVKVPTDNAKSIIANLDEEELQNRLLKAGVKFGENSPILRDINHLDSSPFKNLLKWAFNREGHQLVPISAIEQSLKNLRTFFSFLEDDEDSLFEIFCAIWRVVKENYPDLWGYDNTFMTKVNINALNEFITERLTKAWEFNLIDIFDVESLEKQVLFVVKQIPSEFWEKKWSIPIQDNSNVRKMIKDDLETIVQNYKLRRAWSEGLKLPILNETNESN